MTRQDFLQKLNLVHFIEKYKVYENDGNKAVEKEIRFEAVEIGTEGFGPATPFLGGHGRRITRYINLEGVGALENLGAEALQEMQSQINQAFASDNGIDTHFNIFVGDEISVTDSRLGWITQAPMTGEEVRFVRGEPEFKKPENPMNSWKDAFISAFSAGGVTRKGMASMETSQATAEFIKETLLPTCKPYVVKFVTDPAFHGTLEMFDGASEMGVGAALILGAPATGPLAPITATVGAILIFHGADHFSMGADGFLFNREQETLTSTLAQNLGASPGQAHLIDNGLLIIGSVGGTIVTKVIKGAESVVKTVVKEGLEESDSLVAKGGVKVCPNEVGLVKQELDVTQKVKIGSKKVDVDGSINNEINIFSLESESTNPKIFSLASHRIQK